GQIERLGGRGRGAARRRPAARARDPERACQIRGGRAGDVPGADSHVVVLRSPRHAHSPRPPRSQWGRDMTVELTIEGPESRQRQRVPLEPGRAYVLGRDREADVPVAWDPHISRRHVELTVAGGKLAVRKLEAASTPLFVAGREVETC